MGLQHVKILYNNEIQNVIYDEANVQTLYKTHYHEIQVWAQALNKEELGRGIQIDVGANYGNFSVYIAKQYKPIYVLAIEYDKNKFRGIIKAALLNGSVNLIPYLCDWDRDTLDSVYTGVNCKLLRINMIGKTLDILHGAVTLIMRCAPIILIKINMDERADVMKSMSSLNYILKHKNEKDGIYSFEPSYVAIYRT
jgi:hypothetical protein